MANNYVEPLLCWFSNSRECLGNKNSKENAKITAHTWIARNCIDPVHLSGGFGLNFKILSGWDLNVWPDNESMAIYSSGCPTAAQPSPPIPTAGGSCARNGSCLGSFTNPFASICSLAWSVQASVSSTAGTGGWQEQPKARLARGRQLHVPVPISPSKWELCPRLQDLCSLPSAQHSARSLCHFCVLFLSFFCKQSQSRDSVLRFFEESLTCLLSGFEKDPWHSVIIPLCWWLKICCQ